jgi:hypothetical protein
MRPRPLADLAAADGEPWLPVTGDDCLGQPYLQRSAGEPRNFAVRVGDGWAGMYGVFGHWMVLAEEEHLCNLQGEGYERYCQRVPRYFGFPRRNR